MLFIWGNGGGNTSEGTIGTCKCEVCDKEVPFDATIHYRYFHFWYLFSFLTSRKYVYECSNCHNGYTVEASEFKKKFPKNHIPFIRKAGWLVCLILIASLVALASKSAGEHTNQLQTYLTTPAVNDLYVVDFRQIENSGFTKGNNAFGVMKLEKIRENGDYYFLISSHAYTKKRGVEKLLKDPTSIKFADKEDGMTFTKQQLQSLKDSKIILNVVR